MPEVNCAKYYARDMREIISIVCLKIWEYQHIPESL